uniref:Maturase K n=1 Tax=Panagrolaimus sp. ES5 TaxID=591445 RepID=A0AC34GBH6_9BILA
LLPPFTRAYINFFRLTFRALGRNHKYRIPRVRVSSKLIVKCILTPSSTKVSLKHDPSQKVSFKNPIYSILRANPFPEVTDLICRLPLPTLFYRPEAIHLENLMRNKQSEHNKNRYAFQYLYPYLEMISFHGQNILNREEISILNYI